jgi:hypothetical protein
MRSRFALTLLAVSAYAILSTPVLADSTQPKSAKDPNERICENETMVGSRLTVHRVCATRAEWAEKRRLDREAIDSAQRSPNTGCTTVNTYIPAPTC